MELGNWSTKNQLGSTNSKGLPVLFQGSHQGLHLNNQSIHCDRSHGHAMGMPMVPSCSSTPTPTRHPNPVHHRCCHRLRLLSCLLLPCGPSMTPAELARTSIQPSFIQELLSPLKWSIQASPRGVHPSCPTVKSSRSLSTS